MIKWKYWDTYAPEDYLGFVYKITNLTNGKFYIGKKYRWDEQLGNWVEAPDQGE